MRSSSMPAVRQMTPQEAADAPLATVLGALVGHLTVSVTALAQSLP